MTCYYGLWCPHMLQPELTAEHRDNADVADEFIYLYQSIFCEMTAILGDFAPQEFQQNPLPNDAKRPRGAWSACAVNYAEITRTKQMCIVMSKNAHMAIAAFLPAGIIMNIPDEITLDFFELKTTRTAE